MNWYLEVLKKYAVFDGRARRKEYWYFCLFNFLISFALAAVTGVLGGITHTGSLSLLNAIYSLAILIPGIAVTVRRLHDTDHSGWWMFIILVPFIGAIVLLVFTVMDSTPGENRYGVNPKEISV